MIGTVQDLYKHWAKGIVTHMELNNGRIKVEIAVGMLQFGHPKFSITKQTVVYQVPLSICL